MRIVYVVPTIHDTGGTASAIATQANALCRHHQVEIYSVYRLDGGTHYRLDPRVEVRDLVDLAAAPHRAGVLEGDRVDALRHAPPLLVRPEWDPTLDALADAALEQALPRTVADVVVTVTPSLLALASQLVRPGTALVHQEHRSSSQRSSGMEPLLAFAPRADAVVMLTDRMADWLRDRLGRTAPEIAVVPNALPPGFRPRSLLDGRLVVTAGRLVGEKQFSHLVDAFAQVAEDLPEWRLRILGDGPARFDLLAAARRHGLWDRVELPGVTTDMASEWARASICALTSRTEGYPLVLQEAMAAGVPPVSYDSPSGPRAIIDHGVDGLLVPQDSTAGMAAALLRLATDEPLRHRLGEAAALKAARDWDAEQVAERWARLFEGVLSRRTPGAPGRATQRLLRGLPAPVDRPEAPAAPGVTPEEARTAALRAVVAAAAAGSRDWFVVPPHEHLTATVVVPMRDRSTFLDALAATGLPPFLCLHEPEGGGWPGRLGSVDLVEDLRRGRSGVLRVEPWPALAGRPSVLGRDCGVTVELWEEGPDGLLHPPGPASRHQVPLPPGGATATATVHGTEVPTHRVLLAPTSTECLFPVETLHPVGAGRSAATRLDLLRWGMRSVHLFAPWVRRLHVVTEGAPPAWLDRSHPKVRVVRLDDLLGTVETAGTPGSDAAEHLLEVPDDTFLARPTRPEAWFTPAGHPRVFPAPAAAPGHDDPLTGAEVRARELVGAALGLRIPHGLAPGPRAHGRSALRTALEQLPAGTAGRSEASWSALAQHHALLTGAAHACATDTTFARVVDLGASDVKRQLQVVEGGPDRSVTLRHGERPARPLEVIDGLVVDLLVDRLPFAAPWELDADG